MHYQKMQIRLLENLVNNKKMNMVMVFMIEDNMSSVYFLIMMIDALIEGIINNIIRRIYY